MIYCPEFTVSYFFVLFCFVLISLLGSQLIFLMLVFSSSHAHGRLFREIIDANGAKEITTQDNSFSKFLGPKEEVNDAFEELSERRDMDKGKRKALNGEFNFKLSNANGLLKIDRGRVCKFNHCRCEPYTTCSSCTCTVQ